MTARCVPLRWWDVPAAQALEQRLFPHDAWTVEQFWSELAQPNRRYVAIVQEREVLAYAGLSRVGSDADVQTVAVDSEHQGRGLAREMLHELLSQADQTGVTHTFLEVREDNSAARGLYARLGFQDISRRQRYYPDGADAIIMRRPRPEVAS